MTASTCAYCNRIAHVTLRCPCGAAWAYCGTCAQTAIRAAMEHAIDCARGERALEPAPRPLVRLGVLP